MIDFKNNIALELDQFIELYRSSTLGERRPVEERDIMKQMMENAQLTITAWDGNALVGIARTLTDQGYVAYLADLAVAKSYQGRGVGKELIQRTRESLGPKCMLVLLSAPAANEFYPHIGFKHNPRAWVLTGKDELTPPKKGMIA